MAASDALKKFGKYFLLDQIAQGGMAEIYRARMATNDVGGRLLAIKRIIQSYSANEEFVTMFKAEIKTTSGFTHPNIVQLYDYGEEEGALYIAMEYVDGKNLRQFISRFTEIKAQFPVEVCVYIMEQSAHGMSYAHSYKDKINGKGLNIVHRDISPQNILISYDGAVKVIDFGIAKAVTNAESTRAGVIKGKPSYLSPEQISGEVLDGRSDIFALGIVLWELLTGRKLFASDNDYGVLKLIENCTNHVKPPSMYNPKITKDLDAIVLKCLAKDRNQRYATAEEMQRALHKFLYQFSPEFNPTDLAYYARDLFKNEIVEDRKRLLKLNDKAEQLLLALEKKPVVAPAHAAKPAPDESVREDATISLSKVESTSMSVKAKEAQAQAQSNATSGKAKPGEHTGSFRVVDFNGKEKSDFKIELNGASSSSVQGPESFKPAKQSQYSQASNPRSKTSLDLHNKKSQASSRSPLVALLALVAIGGAYYYLNEEQSAPPAATVQSAAKAMLVIGGNVKAATVSIDDKPVANSLPANINAPAGKSFKLTVFSNGFKSMEQQLTLAAGETRNISAELMPEDANGAAGIAGGSGAGIPNSGKMVQMKLNIQPFGTGTKIRINGAAVDSSGVVSVPLDIALDVFVERDGFRSFRKSISIDSAKLAGSHEYNYEVTLEAAKFGFVSVKTTPSAEAIVIVDGVEERWSTPVSRKRMPIGTYKMKLVNQLLGMEKVVDFTVSEDRFVNIEERLSVNPNEDTTRAPGSSH